MKTFKSFLSLFLFLGAMCPGFAENSNLGLTVVESGMRATLDHHALVIAVPVRSALSAPVRARLNVDHWHDPHSMRKASTAARSALAFATRYAGVA